MKQVILSAVLLIQSVQLLADCAGGGLFFWPYGGVIKQNGILMIEGYAWDEAVITGLNTTYPVYLKAGDEKIKLTVKETCVGQFGLTQAILVPETKLTAGNVYELVIEHTDYTKPFQRWNYKTSQYEAVTWKALPGDDVTKPTWTQKPNESKKTLFYYGCGPEINVHFNFAAYDESPLLIKATVTNVTTSKTTSYYLDATDLTSIGIGHNMCSGAFTYKDTDNDFTITFDLLDGSGNLNTWAYDPVKFTKPTELNSEEY